MARTTMNRRAVLVACGKTKADDRLPAFQFYRGNLVQLSLTAAIYLGDPFILSAKHGLVDMTERLDPYERSLYDMTERERSEWGEQVAEDLPDHYHEVVFLAGEVYALHVNEFLPLHVDRYRPYATCSGNGEMMSVATNMAERLLGGESPDDVL